ncbi:MAG TPA: hypothetical protein VFQ38_04225 [Longimicrobiales bacterium]|nr:hypothetical protein [Longimicrobiales bacterium]
MNVNASLGAESLPSRLLERHRDDDPARATSPRSISTTIEAVDDGDDMGRLLSVARRLYARISTALAHAGLAYDEYRILARLRAAGAPLDVTALADGHAGSSVAAPRGVEGLATRGLIVLDHPAPAGSPANVALTAAGMAAASAGAAALDQLSARFADSLTQPEKEQLGDMIARVHSLSAAPPPLAVAR